MTDKPYAEIDTRSNGDGRWVGVVLRDGRLIHTTEPSESRGDAWRAACQWAEDHGFDTLAF